MAIEPYNYIKMCSICVAMCIIGRIQGRSKESQFYRLPFGQGSIASMYRPKVIISILSIKKSLGPIIGPKDFLKDRIDYTVPL